MASRSESHGTRGRVVVTLAVGAIGAVLAVAVNLPLAFLLGPLLATTVAGLSGMRLGLPLGFRRLFIALLGVFLASRFSPAVVADMAGWPVTLAAVLPFVLLTTYPVAAYYRRAAGLDSLSALFAALPGGLTLTVLLGGAVGADEARIAVAQTMRVLAAVLVTSLILWLGFDLHRDQAELLRPPAAIDWAGLAAAGAGAVAGLLLATRLRVPVPELLGPLCLLAPCYATGLLDAGIPFPLIAAAMWVLGASFGSQVGRLPRRLLLGFGGHALLAVTLLFAICLLFAGALSALLDIRFAVLLLAFSPGGISEMSLIALALDLDPAFVVAHHLVRIFACNIGAPLLVRWQGGASAP
jgi:hypothetical protein